MIIRSITVSGENKADASLYFQHGANIVAGASDTGKSYVVKCLAFILGAKNSPKTIDEAKGYTTLTVTFENEDSSLFSLVRELRDEAPIILVETEKPPRPLKAKHQAGKLDNLSNFFLEKLKLNDKLLLQGKESLRTSSLSLRNLEKLFLIDEARIVAEYSPLGTGQNNGSTSEQALLKVLLTGVDDSEAKQLKKELSSRASIQQKAQAIQELITNLYPENTIEQESIIEELELALETEERELEKAEAELTIAISNNNTLINQKRSLTDKILATDSKLNESSALLQRFGSLEEKYQSDQERLIGIREATGLLELYEDIVCPTCGSEISNDNPELIGSHVLAGIQVEVRKIEFNIKELFLARETLSLSIESDNEAVSNQQEKLREIDLQLEGALEEKIEKVSLLKSKAAELTRQILGVQHQINSKNKLISELGRLADGLSEEQEIYTTDEINSELAALSTSIESILQRWDFPNHHPTVFDFKSRDIKLAGKPRSHFGKGYRAIGFSAVAIGLMQHLLQEGRHPGFVVLDSPLTTYKQADQDQENEDEVDAISGDLIYSFYSDIAENYKNSQIIIFDNQEPDMALIPKINYTHFSKNNNIGRYGFFPANAT